GAKINLDDSTLENAFISTVAGSTITSLTKTTNSISSGNLDNAGAIAVNGGSTLNLNASVDNTGQVKLNGGTTAAQLMIYGGGAQLFDGGKVILTNSANNLIGSAASAATSGTQFTNNDNTITGAGTIGDANLRFVNLSPGIVDSNASAGLILV